jgi:hypothetical protein
VEIAQGLGWGGGEATRTEGARSNCKKDEWDFFDRSRRYLYLYNPESPGQVRNIRETQTSRKNPGDSAPPESSEQIFKEFDFG